MKKLLLLFASMFFVLGTSVAQDKGDGKDEGNGALALQYSIPADGEYLFTVYNIRLQFNKEIVVTLPKGGIDVTNKTTGDVVKITHLDNNESIEKSTAVFLFEQKSVYDEKEGKEELKDQVIETPGEWSYTIPAGCIKSIDNEEFAEQTFTFKIATSMEIESISPEDAVTTLDKIEVTFPKPIASVKTSKLSIVDNYWMPVKYFKSEVTFSDDRKTVTLELEEPITTPGTYNLDIYQGVFLSDDGALNSNKSVRFEVFDPAPSFSTNYNDGEKVEELGNLEITFRNVNNVEIINNKAINVLTPAEDLVAGEAKKNDAGDKIIVTFPQEFKEEGTYTFSIPAGAFKMDGTPNEQREINVELFTFTITPLEVVSVTPEAGPVDQIDRIIIEFNQTVELYQDENWQQVSREIKLKGEKEEYTLTFDSNAGISNKIVYLVNAVYNKANEWEITPITEEGKYTLDLADVIVNYAAEDYIDEWGYPNLKWHAKNAHCEGTYTWTIGEDNGDDENSIDSIEAENGTQTIYDLTGRVVNKATNGIYIVNGKKMLVK